jgi:hypothetical protein
MWDARCHSRKLLWSRIWITRAVDGDNLPSRFHATLWIAAHYLTIALLNMTRAMTDTQDTTFHDFLTCMMEPKFERMRTRSVLITWVGLIESGEWTFEQPKGFTYSSIIHNTKVFEVVEHYLCTPPAWTAMLVMAEPLPCDVTTQ